MRLDAKLPQAPASGPTPEELFPGPVRFIRGASLTLKVLFRRRMGMRRCKPGRLILMVAVMYLFRYLALIVASIMNLPALFTSLFFGGVTLRPTYIFYFSIAMLIAGLWQHARSKRIVQQYDVEPLHTFSDGISPFEDVIRVIAPSSKAHPPLPLSREWWVSEARASRFLDPLFLFAVGYLLLPVDWTLAWWIMVASVCLAIDESMTWEQQLDLMLDLYDNRINAKTTMEVMSDDAPLRSPTKGLDRERGAVVSTGVDEDIRRQVDGQAAIAETRRRQLPRPEPKTLPQDRTRALNAPDNLVESEDEAR